MDLHQSLAVLDRLSIEQRGKRLEPLEREILTIAWNKESYCQSENYQEQTVKNRAVKLWKYLSELLRTKVNKHNLQQVLAGLDLENTVPELLATPNIDRPRRSKFYGRLTELWQLQAWIESEQSKLIFLYGMKGIGKTTLAHKLTEQLAPKLDRVIWISLAAAPTLIETLTTIIKQAGGGRDAKLAKNIQTAIDKTIAYLQANRCLLIFDNADPVLNQADRLTSNLFTDYCQFFDRLNSVTSDVCCITISTEQCSAINSSYRQLEISKLDQSSCQELISTSELTGTTAEWEILIDLYLGNPQYLKIVANTIADIFAGKIEQFLATNLLVYQQIEILLSQQLDQLSNPELSIMIWLAIEGKSISLEQLRLITSVSISNANTAKILDTLVRKYLVEVTADRFTLSDLIMEFVTARYQDLVCKGITAKKFDVLHVYPISRSKLESTSDQSNPIEQSFKYSQDHCSPIIDRLLIGASSKYQKIEILSEILFPSPSKTVNTKQNLAAKLQAVLQQLDPINTNNIDQPSYAIQNINHLIGAINLKALM
jgi:adenylate kinase family enzyme